MEAASAAQSWALSLVPACDRVACGSVEGLRRRVMMARRAGARKAGGGTGLATVTAASAFFRWLRRQPLRPSPSPAASSAAPPVSNTPPVTSFLRPIVGLLPALLQVPGAGMAKGGEELREVWRRLSAEPFLEAVW
jgi:hypothetical protein